MSITLQDCLAILPEAVHELFDADPRIQAVGVTRHESTYAIKAVQNQARVLPASSRRTVRKPPDQLQDVPVIVEPARADIGTLTVTLPLSSSFIPERGPHRPLVCGLQIQNFDDDNRQREAGNLGPTEGVIGAIGCFVKDPEARIAILSNNHVLAGENSGVKGKDRILQPGSLSFRKADQVALLTEFEPLKPSPARAKPAKGNVVYNHADAAYARLIEDIAFRQEYLAARALPAPSGTAKAKLGDRVFKVGPRTGLTHGKISAVGTVVGPIPYDPGPCWFQDQIEITGANGTLFSDQGDSGAIVVNQSGKLIGLLFAGNGTHSYASPIETVLKLLACQLV